MAKLPTAFHVGYQKCASTYLQNALFGQHPEIFNLGKGSDSFDRHLRDLFINKPLQVPVEKEIKLFWREKFEAEGRQAKVALFSQENLADFFGIDPGVVARRLHAVAPDAQIILVIRNQSDFLSSIYTHNVACGKMRMSMEDWIEFQDRNMRANSWLHHADYYQTVTLFDGLFGRDNVHVFLVEDLKSDERGFMRGMCIALQIDPQLGEVLIGRPDRLATRGKNKKMARQSKWAILARRSKWVGAIDRGLRPYSSQAVRSFIGRVTGLGGKSHTVLSPDLQAYIAERYARGNRRLAQRLGRDLGAVGFPL